MNLLFGLILGLTALQSAFAPPAAARVWESHDAWATICRPVDGEPFRVEANSYVGGTIKIYGRDGRPWTNTITNSEDLVADGAFGVDAYGPDAHGHARTITMVFAPNFTLLAVNHDVDHEITCDNAHGISGD